MVKNGREERGSWRNVCRRESTTTTQGREGGRGNEREGIKQGKPPWKPQRLAIVQGHWTGWVDGAFTWQVAIQSGAVCSSQQTSIVNPRQRHDSTTAVRAFPTETNTTNLPRTQQFRGVFLTIME
ncbi:uncharacterized protein CIMG_13587 [Coccidioides immitis RS]|uniref:Uncharacterized protein n=1 Tax=Coccidioides immitis (strain RS) TaxID=246410 RepID=A0A0D8JWM1_COCIM|nr:uncharacterized protein CIMG_13587 [Coccidioides immitis RS]KJF61336.1 hypothetical protein CIMG_13587 [Coccidioides immitis RS]